jgi:hypothetical protein
MIGLRLLEGRSAELKGGVCRSVRHRESRSGIDLKMWVARAWPMKPDAPVMRIFIIENGSEYLVD